MLTLYLGAIRSIFDLGDRPPFPFAVVEADATIYFERVQFNNTNIQAEDRRLDWHSARFIPYTGEFRAA